MYNYVDPKSKRRLPMISSNETYDIVTLNTDTYNLMSKKWFTHASPTMFNAGTCRPQLASCFCSQWWMTPLRVFARRLPDAPAFLNPLEELDSMSIKFAHVAHPSQGPMELQTVLCRCYVNLMLCHVMWIRVASFMKRVMEDKVWSLMCPNECPGLDDCWGEKFEELFHRYEDSKMYGRQLPARDVWLVPNGNWYSLHGVQVLMQSKIKPTKLGDNQMLKSLHRG